LRAAAKPVSKQGSEGFQGQLRSLRGATHLRFSPPQLHRPRRVAQAWCNREKAPNGPRAFGDQHDMKFFADTAEISEIRELAETGLLDGVTTNPTLIHKSGRNFLEVVKEIAGIVAGPVSAEVVALDHGGMMREAEVLRRIADNVAIKVPLTPDGLKTCKALTSEGTMVNVTLCFSAAQALLAAKAGATFISPFVGRHDDVGFDGMALIADIRLIYDNYDYETQILVASVRHPMHVVEAAKIGADVMTAPPKIIHQLFKHPLTDNGIASFLKDWEQTGQKI
jgi:transaldolase